MKDKRNIIVCVTFENTKSMDALNSMVTKIALDENSKIEDILKALGDIGKISKWSEVFTLLIDRDLPFKEVVNSISGLVSNKMKEKGADFFSITSITEIDYQD